MTNHGGTPRAIIVGGSMAGIFSALLLSRAGWRVDVYERVKAELAGRGAGIVTHPELWHTVAKAGIRCEPKELGVEVSGRVVVALAARVAGPLPLPHILPSCAPLSALPPNPPPIPPSPAANA